MGGFFGPGGVVSELSTLDWRKIIEGAFDATETFLYCILNITTMAKSLRSKWKRKMKAEKRVRYGQKERDRLEKMLASYDKEEKERQEQKEKELMEHEPQVLGATEERTEEKEKDAMDTSSSKQAPKHSSKSLKSQHGNYPKWMSNRKIQKAKNKGKKLENKVNKRKKRNYL